MSQIGQSEHFPVQLKFETNQIGEFYVRKDLMYQFGKIRNNALTILKKLRTSLRQLNKVEEMIDLIKNLRKKYKTKLRKAGNIKIRR